MAVILIRTVVGAIQAGVIGRLVIYTPLSLDQLHNLLLKLIHCSPLSIFWASDSSLSFISLCVDPGPSATFRTKLTNFDISSRLGGGVHKPRNAPRSSSVAYRSHHFLKCSGTTRTPTVAAWIASSHAFSHVRHR